LPTHRPARRGAAPDNRSDPRSSSGYVEILYGRNAVREALRGHRQIGRVIISHGVVLDDRLEEIVQLAAGRGIGVDRRSRIAIDERVGPVNHQGVLAEAGRYRYADSAAIADRPGVVIALDHLKDPQNVGTLLRAGLALFAAGALIPSDRAAEITPAVVNASAGATEHLAIAQVTNLVRELARMKEAGRWVVGLDTGDDAVNIVATPLPQPAVLVIGAEGKGIGRLVRERCDLIVTIPISATIDSLNAATAGSIALFELERQRLLAL